MPLKIIHGECSIATYALLDNGATGCGISNRLVEKLQLPVRIESRGLSSWGYEGVALRELTSFGIESLDGKTKLQVDEALVGQVLTTEHERPPALEDIEVYPYMEGIVTFEELECESVDVLLSARFAHTWELGERVSNGPDNPIAIRTSFGWGLIGARDGNNCQSFSMQCCAFKPPGESIEENLVRVLRYDFLSRTGEHASPEQEHPSREDCHAVAQFEATIEFDEDLQHYRCGIPWKVDRQSAAAVINCMDTASNAKNRLRKAAARMHREPERKEGVWNQIQEYINEGHAREVVDPEVPADIAAFYLPIHVVTRPDKPGKWRVCHDAAAKVPYRAPSGKVMQLCLNDMLLAGPDLVSRLIGVLLRFRWNPVVISADIRAFFHQIFVHGKDVPAFRFFWFKDKQLREMVMYEMLVHIFGSKSSPAVATWVLRYHAKRIAAEAPPEVVQALLWFFYVDDLLASYKDVDTAKRVRVQLTEAMKKGGFDLLKWKSTHKGVLESDETGDQGEKQWDDPRVEFPTEKVLGVAFSFQNDCFAIRIGQRAGETVGTRRQMLRLIASVFDPIGFAAPAVLKGKMLFQTATSLGLDWDDPLPDELCQSFNTWRTGLKELEKIRINRWIATENTYNGAAELHVFSDASLEGYGIVAYVRIVGVDGTISVSLVNAKAQVVPIETVKRVSEDQEAHKNSIPRLELTAARLAAIIKDMVVREMEPVTTLSKFYLWTDSETVMKWIQDRKTRYKTFIHNRKSAINELTDVSDWRTLPSEENPADDCSRGLDPGDEKWTRFVHGPGFLWKTEDQWPKQKPMRSEISLVVGALNVGSSGQKASKAVDLGWVLRIADKVGEWPKKVRRIALFVNFFRQWSTNRQKVSLTKIFPTLVDVHGAQNLLIKGIQQKGFSSELKLLNKPSGDGQEVELRLKTSPIIHLNPFLDSAGLLRAGGRLSHATNIAYDLKYPKILPKDDTNVVALIREEHQNQGHAGPNQVFSSLSRRYWILHGRELVKRIIHRCATCQILYKQPGQQKMSDLPADRVDVCSPFEVTAIDVFGPFAVRNGGRGTHKRWVILFTCMTCRAVHFELLRDMSSATFINALVRFHGRRPGLRVLWSDCGTNFRGANRELKRAVNLWNEETAGELLSKGIEWKFTPPNAAHCGGCWERLIKDAKRHIAALVTHKPPDLDVFATMLVEVERIMNNRPLTYASSDIRDLSVLTPSNFLYPGVITQTSINILPPAPPGGESIRYQWQKARALVDAFWSRWTGEYLHTLQSRTKWQKTQPNLYVGQIVLITDENLPRDQWRWGRIEWVGAQNGTVRKAGVKLTSGKILERHVTKLVGLELE